MRTFEYLILACILVSLLGKLVTKSKRPRFVEYLPGLAVLFILLHLIWEGYRWQMAPSFALALILFTFTIPGIRPNGKMVSRRGRLLRVVAASLGLLLYIPTIAMPVVSPVFRLPEPTGSHAIGTAAFSVRDTSRGEPLTADPDDHRELLIRVWYPATPDAEAQPVPYDPYFDRVGPALAEALELPSFWFDHFRLVPAHAHADAPVSDAAPAYPVILFSHGYAAGVVTQNTVLCEELASHGYVVVSVGHTYEALILAHPDGRVVSVDKPQVDLLWSEVRLARQGKLEDIIRRSGSLDEQRRAMAQAMARAPTLQKSFDCWVDDLGSVLDELAAMNRGERPSPFEGLLDLEHVGNMGMSFGGAVANYAPHRETRIRAGLNLDGDQVGMSIFEGHTIPFMHMCEDKEKDEEDIDIPFENAEGAAYRVAFENVKHLNFSDASIMAPLFARGMGFVGPVDGDFMLGTINAYALAFFDKHLKDRPSPILQEDATPPEGVTFAARNL